MTTKATCSFVLQDTKLGIHLGCVLTMTKRLLLLSTKSMNECVKSG